MAKQALSGMSPLNASGQYIVPPNDPLAWCYGYFHDPVFQQAWGATGIPGAMSGVSHHPTAANHAIGASVSPGLFGGAGGADSLFGDMSLGASALGLGAFGAMGDPFFGGGYAMAAPGEVMQRPGSYIEMMNRDARGELYGPFSNPAFLKFAAERYDGALNLGEWTIRKDRLIGLLERFYGTQGMSMTALYNQYSKEAIDQMAERFIADNQNNYHNTNALPLAKHAAAGGVGGAVVGVAGVTVTGLLAKSAWMMAKGLRFGWIGAAIGALVGAASYLLGVQGSQNQFTDTRGLSKEDLQLAIEHSSARQQGARQDLSIRDPRFLTFLLDHVERYNTSWVSGLDGEAISASRMKEAAADFNAQYGQTLGKIDVNSPRFNEDYNMLTIANDRTGWYDATVEKADLLATLRANSLAQQNYTPASGVRY